MHKPRPIALFAATLMVMAGLPMAWADYAARITGIQADPDGRIHLLVTGEGFDPLLRVEPNGKERYRIIIEGRDVGLEPGAQADAERLGAQLTSRIPAVFKSSATPASGNAGMRIVLETYRPLIPQVRENTGREVIIVLMGDGSLPATASSQTRPASPNTTPASRIEAQPPQTVYSLESPESLYTAEQEKLMRQRLEQEKRLQALKSAQNQRKRNKNEPKPVVKFPDLPPAESQPSQAAAQPDWMIVPDNTLEPAVTASPAEPKPMTSGSPPSANQPANPPMEEEPTLDSLDAGGRISIDGSDAIPPLDSGDMTPSVPILLKPRPSEEVILRKQGHAVPAGAPASGIPHKPSEDAAMHQQSMVPVESTSGMPRKPSEIIAEPSSSAWKPSELQEQKPVTVLAPAELPYKPSEMVLRPAEPEPALEPVELFEAGTPQISELPMRAPMFPAGAPIGAGPATPPLQQAQDQLSRGDLSGAAATLEKHLAGSPHDGEARLWLARVYLSQAATASSLPIAKSRQEGAVDVLRKLVEEQPRHLEGIRMLASTYLAMDRIDDAERLLRDALSNWPNDPELYYAQGQVMEARFRLNEARAAYKQAVSGEPSNPEYRYRLAQVELKADNPAAARWELMQAISISPDDQRLWKLLGFIAERSQDPAQAEAHYRQAMSADAMINYARMLDQQKRRTDALAVYQAVERIAADDADVQYNLGMIYAQMRQRQRAEVAFKRFMQLAPKDARVATAKQTLESLQP